MYIKINNETVITEDNVQKVGEALAISSILYACYHILDKYIRKYRHIAYTTDSKTTSARITTKFPLKIKKKMIIPFVIPIYKMNLKQGELDTLNCYMAGMTYCEIARFLDVNFSTIYRRRLSLQKKYMQAIY